MPQGRIDSDEKILKSVKKKLIDQPDYVYDYFIYNHDATARTREKQIGQVIRLIEYLDVNCIIQTDNPENFQTLKPSDISLYVEQMDAKPNTRITTIRILKNFFNFLVNEGHIGTNPCDKVKVPHKDSDPEIVYLNEKEIALIAENIRHPWGNAVSKKNRIKYMNQNLLIYYLGLTTGLRRASIVEINVEDIDFRRREIRVSQKGDRIHYVHYNEKIEEVLNAWLEDRSKILAEQTVYEEALFIDTKCRRITEKYITNLLGWCSAGVNKHVTPHVLRKTCATLLYDRTGDIYLTAKVLGHASVKTTSRYAKVSMSKEQKAVDVLTNIAFGNKQDIVDFTKYEYDEH